MTQLSPIEIDPKTFLYEHCSLPALPEVLTQIQNIILSKDIDIDRIADLINRDPSLVAQILKIVNSAYYGLPVEISNTKLAVAYLGINTIHRIVLSISVVNTLATEEKKELNTIWLHSVFAALCAKSLASKFEPLLNTDELWSAAILHDIGKLIYLKFSPDQYKEINKFSNINKCLFSEAEKHYSLPSSAYLGTLLCDRWRLPNNIRQACSFHGLHDLTSHTNKGATGNFTSMISLGNVTAVLLSDELKKEKKIEIAQTIKTSLQIEESEFLVLMGELSELQPEAEKFMLHDSQF